MNLLTFYLIIQNKSSYRKYKFHLFNKTKISIFVLKGF